MVFTPRVYYSQPWNGQPWYVRTCIVVFANTPRNRTAEGRIDSRSRRRLRRFVSSSGRCSSSRVTEPMRLVCQLRIRAIFAWRFPIEVRHFGVELGAFWVRDGTLAFVVSRCGRAFPAESRGLLPIFTFQGKSIRETFPNFPVSIDLLGRFSPASWASAKFRRPLRQVMFFFFLALLWILHLFMYVCTYLQVVLCCCIRKRLEFLYVKIDLSTCVPNFLYEKIVK